ncbi:hypothetical protein DDE05_26405, partial [Streptomyces cavourensis]
MLWSRPWRCAGPPEGGRSHAEHEAHRAYRTGARRSRRGRRRRCVRHVRDVPGGLPGLRPAHRAAGRRGRPA